MNLKAQACFKSTYMPHVFVAVMFEVQIVCCCHFIPSVVVVIGICREMYYLGVKLWNMGTYKLHNIICIYINMVNYGLKAISAMTWRGRYNNYKVYNFNHQLCHTWHGAAKDLSPHTDAATVEPGARVDSNVACHHGCREHVQYWDLLLFVPYKYLLRQAQATMHWESRHRYPQ